MFLDIGKLGEGEGTLFSFEEGPRRPFERFENHHTRIIFERDLNEYNLERTTYKIFDMLGEIGGLLEFSSLLGAVLMSICQFQAFENYLVSLLYKG